MLTRKPQPGDWYGTPGRSPRLYILETTNTHVISRTRLNTMLRWTWGEFWEWFNDSLPIPQLVDVQGNPIYDR